MPIHKPLAEQLRPAGLTEYIGQEHLVGPGAILRRAIESGSVPSMIMWGPPGVGKTTLAHIISGELGRPFFTLSAVSSGVREVREVIATARGSEKGAILFIDEIHRFNKSQQDSLLSAVEQGVITLIGATTENPSFEVIPPLLSRCQVYILKELDLTHLTELLERGRKFLEQLMGLEIRIKEDKALMRVSGGDARKLLNALELVVQAMPPGKGEIVVTDDEVMNVVQKNLALYDKSGEMHFDIISAFIKSLRGSDPNGAVYWLARMVEAGEDPKFIARRMVILASEDIGNANPTALVLAQACFDAVHTTGYPECRIILSQTATYLACSPKSNASYMAIEKALGHVRNHGDLPVPLHIRNAPTRLMKEIGYGKGYRYAHDFEDNFADLEFLPDRIRGTTFYEPGDNPREKEMRERLRKLWKNKYGY
ncbi:MAG: replication-associated recombination protein A [Bacteroidales bacterium]|nr:replication-associated recombination protein A [Bacteroidales bacterium]